MPRYCFFDSLNRSIRAEDEGISLHKTLLLLNAVPCDAVFWTLNFVAGIRGSSSPRALRRSSRRHKCCAKCTCLFSPFIRVASPEKNNGIRSGHRRHKDSFTTVVLQLFLVAASLPLRGQFYKIEHLDFLCLEGCGRGLRTARIASSKTLLRFRWVSAEHSRYL